MNPESAAAIEKWLVDHLVTRLGVAESEIERHVPFVAYGLDSIELVAMAEQLGDWLGRPLPPAVAWDHPTVADLAAHLGHAATSPLAPPSRSR